MGKTVIKPFSISGNNYIKFAEGTLIQYGTIDLPSGTGAINANFDINFINTDYSVTAIIDGSVNSPIFIGVKHTYAVMLKSDVSGYDRAISWIAIGKWK